MKEDRERRIIDAEMRVSRAEGEPPKITGYAAVFNSLSENLGGFREQIAPGAFSEAIGVDDVRALWNHNPDHILGRTRAKTLTLREDERGLAIEIIPPDTQLARDLMTSMERGDVTQMSFAFSVKPNGQNWGTGADGEDVRTLTNVHLYDVSPVTYPAYTDTTVAVRNLHEWKKEKKEELPPPDLGILRRRLDLLELE